MFRSKKKKTQGRKRREVEEVVEDEDISQDANASINAGLTDSNAPETAESELQVLEELRRSRSRSSKSSLTFSSKAPSSRSSLISGQTTVVGSAQKETTLLSFDDGETTTKRQKSNNKTKMRPNLVASGAVDVEMESETVGQYSAEMLASLRSEQSVLLPNRSDDVTQESDAAAVVDDVQMEEVMEVEDGNGGEVAFVEEEFIPLQAQKMKSRRTKNRVTFGVHSDGPNLPKAAEVVEEVLSGEEDEDNENNRRWEEELMRRGGHRVTPLSETSASRSSDDGLPTYPTRKKVSCVSLMSVLTKLEKAAESTAFEDERASRELARLEAETALSETTLKQQHEELLASSEEFEYFQEVEDFVKGLSFCLREKVPVIEIKEKDILEERVQRVTSKRQEEILGFVEEIQMNLRAGKLQEVDVVGLSQLALHLNGDTVTPTNDLQRAVRLRKYQQHFSEPYACEPKRMVREDNDLFADAIDEINSLEHVYGRFQEWKAKFPSVYDNVYCELAQEKLYAPYVQAELLHWDPLAVAETAAEQLKTWSLDDFSWFQVLHQHLPKPENGKSGDITDGPSRYQVRDVLLEKVRVAVSSYFDPYSSLQARSLALLLEEINRHGYTSYAESTLRALMTTALDTFSNEAKSTTLLAVDQATAKTQQDVSLLARYLIERFNALQDNLLTLFVALPKGDIAAAGFRCLLQVFHHLLGYVRHCQEAQRMQYISTATQIVRQLSGSSYLLQMLTHPSQERELKHMMDLFDPFLQLTG
ncbi:hypothetical protein PHYBOEH_005263 [Phytophthora boehmeriae]|uniref:GCF C-terminal domain-containing protein n=1 Tax=Phytophthora boehmeriae TaxID=109152 RepID=A0A8T1WKC1_9STRA|nr:hypothetical protein PHYBOEH_005263 [Phytophthora boehmeriae]